jgi:hypothetical protein
LTSKEFCRRREISAATLLWWSSQLSRKRVGRATGRKERVAMARVVARSSNPEARTAIRIELGGARVDVGPGTDRATLALVLEALRAVPVGAAS